MVLLGCSLAPPLHKDAGSKHDDRDPFKRPHDLKPAWPRAPPCQPPRLPKRPIEPELLELDLSSICASSCCHWRHSFHEAWTMGYATSMTASPSRPSSR